MAPSTRMILNDREVTSDLATGTVLLDFIRQQQRLCGTKIGCREGDCGACTVLVGELDGTDPVYRSMTSCLMPLGNAHGKHVVTVEGLNLEKGLNLVQKAIAEEGGTQCGFCTPGFVVSFAGFCLSRKMPQPDRAVAAVDGNICRCTGYKSLERAAARIAEALRDRDGDASLPWLVDRGFLPEYFKRIPHRLQRLSQEIGTPPEPQGSLDAMVGGGTDLYVQRPESLAEQSPALVLGRASLRGIGCENGRCVVGAAATAEDLKDSPVFRRCVPKIDAFMKLVSSTPIRNMGTVAGNFVNASPIGDLTILFLALNSTVELRGPHGVRSLALRDFYRGYKDVDLLPGETLASVSFPLTGPASHVHFEKVCKRTHLDIASVNTAIRLEMDGDTIADAGVSAGGVAPIPLYLERTSAFLIGKTVDGETVRLAAETAQSEISPIGDARGSAAYKRLLLRQLVYAHFLTLFPESVALEALS